ncbi:MAG: hypothetical protein ABUL62_33955 [Myxococcales bacterium]|jgi:hypothetical protein
MLLATAKWEDINAFRERVAHEISHETSLTDAAQRFTSLFVETFPSIVLARVFAVIPFETLPATESEFAVRLAERLGARDVLGPKTPVLSLLGSHGAELAWRARERSSGHLAIPLLSKAMVEGAPMIAQLMSALKVDLARLDDGGPIYSRPMLGSTNQRFYVPSARTARDFRGNFVIPAQDFVALHNVETVFGMAGSYVDGMLIAAILFTNESLDSLTVDRFPSIISNFKMATTELVLARRIYGPVVRNRQPQGGDASGQASR